MTLEATEDFNTLQANALSALSSTPAESTETTSGSSEPTETSETPAQGETPSQSSEAPKATELQSVKESDELGDIQRVIASDPYLRAQYKSQKTGLPVEAFLVPPPEAQPQAAPVQQQQIQQVQPQPKTLEEMFPEGFDAYDPKHQALMIQSQLGEALSPFAAFIQQQQAEIAYQQQVMQQQAGEAQRSKLVDVLDTMVPGIKALDALPPEKMTAEHMAFGAFVEQRLAQELAQVNPAYARDERVLNAMLKQIEPEVKALASKLGIVQGKPVANNQALASSHVESSTATQQASGSQFDELLKKGDLDKAAMHLFRSI